MMDTLQKLDSAVVSHLLFRNRLHSFSIAPFAENFLPHQSHLPSADITIVQNAKKPMPNHAINVIQDSLSKKYSKINF